MILVTGLNALLVQPNQCFVCKLRKQTENTDLSDGHSAETKKMMQSHIYHNKWTVPFFYEGEQVTGLGKGAAHKMWGTG